MRQTSAGAAVIIDAANSRILGAHVLGVNAEEVINVFSLAIRHGMTRADLSATTWAYPTAVSDINYIV